jgi:hypothetical protein
MIKQCKVGASMADDYFQHSAECPECSALAPQPEVLVADGCPNCATALDTLTRALSADRGEADFHTTRAEQAESALAERTQERDEALRIVDDVLDVLAKHCRGGREPNTRENVAAVVGRVITADMNRIIESGTRARMAESTLTAAVREARAETWTQAIKIVAEWDTDLARRLHVAASRAADPTGEKA